MGTVLGMIIVVLFASAVVPAVLPLMLHAAMVLTFMLSKLFRPLLQKPTELLLLRFYESEKGVLTLLAVGLGAITELAIKAIKYAGS